MSFEIGQSVITIKSPKPNTLAYGLIERTFSMSYKIAPKAVDKDEEGDQ